MASRWVSADIWLVILGIGVAQILLAGTRIRELMAPAMTFALIAAAASRDSPHRDALCHGSNFLCDLNYDTLISSALAIIVTLAIGLRASPGRCGAAAAQAPDGSRMFLGYVRSLPSRRSPRTPGSSSR